MASNDKHRDLVPGMLHANDIKECWCQPGYIPDTNAEVTDLPTESPEAKNG